MNMPYTQKENIPLKTISDKSSLKSVINTAQEFQLSELVTTIIESWKLVLVIVIFFFLSGIFYNTLVRPVYQADVLLQIEQKSKGIGALTELSDLLQEDSPVTAEFEILRSRMVLGTVVDNLKLDIVHFPKYFPIIGAAIARRNASSESIVDPWFGPESYAWGGDNIQVETFSIPSRFHGKPFIIEAGQKNDYKLYEPEGKSLAEGTVGKLLLITLEGGDKIKVFVSELKSKPRTQFILIKNARLAAINQLKTNLKITELGKMSGVLQMKLDGPNRKIITDTLNEIANIYLRQSVERKSAEAHKTLSFLERQLPKLKDKMDSAEAELNNYRLQKGSVDLPLETQATLEKIVDVDAQLTELRTSRDELIRRFTSEHPRIAAVDAKIETLNAEMRKMDEKVKGLPGTQQEILRLTRNAQVNSELYTALLNNAQELKVVKAGAVGNVRIVDHAVVPLRPVKPKKALVIALCIVLGLIIGIGTAILNTRLKGAIQDPDLIEKKLGLPVYATVPFSRKQSIIDRDSQKDFASPDVLATSQPDDQAIESLRSLRTTLYFAQSGTQSNIISITSPTPGAGKSFVSVNLSVVLAGADKKVLLIDGDLRKGRIHKFFGNCDVGLSDTIVGGVDIAQVCRQTGIENLDVIPAGSVPPNPSELLLHKNFSLLLNMVADNFDHVIIDSPPVLAVADAAIIGRMSGATLLVIKDGQSPLREIEQSISRLQKAGVNLTGAVYNGIKLASRRYGYGKYYGYTYTDGNKAKKA